MTGSGNGETGKTGQGPTRGLGLVVGAALFALMLLAPAPAGLDPAAWRAAAVAVLMALWWITEAIPIPATALLPLVLFPLLGITEIGPTAAPYAHRLVFLFLGGFMIALAMQRWNLHRRIALLLIGLFGRRPAGIVAGFMLATALLSMWVSNTATTLMMLPIGLSVTELLRSARQVDPAQGATGPAATRGGDEANFATAMMLGIAYAASIGGVGTLIGTPPNAFMAAFMSSTYGVEIGFGEWLLVGLPLVAVMLPLAWLVLVRVAFPFSLPAAEAGADVIGRELAEMGRLSRGERTVLVVFVLTALLWVFRPFIAQVVPGLNDTTIAIAGALALFLIPVDLRRGVFALNWEWAQRTPWGVLILFGGGLTLASAIKSTGLAAWIGGGTGELAGVAVVVIVLAVTGLIILLTELTSNTATTATFVPIVASVAIGLGENPLLLVVPAAVAASYAFMMPVATPPNAIVFGSGHINIRQMVRAGFLLNLIGVVVITLFCYSVVTVVLGIEAGVLPDWAQGGGG